MRSNFADVAIPLKYILCCLIRGGNGGARFGAQPVRDTVAGAQPPEPKEALGVGEPKSKGSFLAACVRSAITKGAYQTSRHGDSGSAAGSAEHPEIRAV